MKISYSGTKIKVFNTKGTQVVTIRTNGRDPIKVYEAIKAVLATQTRGV